MARQKNPFKTLFRTADWLAMLRIGTALGVGLHSESVVVAIATFILMSALTDAFLLRPLFEKTFLATPFSEEDIAWLKAKQDVTPTDLMVFFRDILRLRAISLGLALASLPVISTFTGLLLAVSAAPVVYGLVFAVMFSLLQHRSSSRLPKKYRPNPCNICDEPPYEGPVRDLDIADLRGRAHRLGHRLYHS